MRINEILYNLVACLLIALAFLLYYISIANVNNINASKKGTALELSEVLINYKLPGMSFIFIFILYYLGAIILFYQVSNGNITIRECCNINSNSMILTSVTLVSSFAAINYSINDTDYFAITMKDIIIHKNVSKYILWLFINCFVIFIIVLFCRFFTYYGSIFENVIIPIYVASLLLLITCEIIIVSKVFNIYFSSKKSRLKLLTNLYYYRFDDLSKNEYLFKYKNYIDGVYYLAGKLYKNIIKYNISKIDIIQPSFGLADFYKLNHDVSSSNLIKSILIRICLCNFSTSFMLLATAFLIPTVFSVMIVKCVFTLILGILCINNYIKMRKMIKDRFDGIIYSENELERFIKKHMGMDSIIVYGKKYSTMRFENILFRDVLSKNIVNLIIYLRVLFIAFKQNYSINDCNNKIKAICNAIINKYDNRIILYILIYLVLADCDCDKIIDVVKLCKKRNKIILLETYKKAICFFKLNCFYGDIEKYNRLLSVI